MSDCCDLEPNEGWILLPKRGKIRTFIQDWKFGRKNQYPICCIFRFSLNSALMDGKLVSVSQGPASKRGVVFRGDPEKDDVFVPCCIFHSADMSLKEKDSFTSQQKLPLL